MTEPLVRLLAPIFAAARPFSFVWGVLVPGAIFAFSFWITWALYRKFARGRR